MYLTNEKFVTKIPLLKKRQINYVLSVKNEPLALEVQEQFSKSNIRCELIRFIEDDATSQELQRTLEFIAS